LVLKILIVGYYFVKVLNRINVDNPDESKMMAAHFNIAMKAAVTKCQEILVWRKLDIKKYNNKSKVFTKTHIQKRPFKTILDEIVTIEDPQKSTKMDFTSPTDSISTISTVSTTPPEKQGKS
jgi:hypothetical protein